MIKREEKVPKYLADHGLESGHPETGSPGIGTSAEAGFSVPGADLTIDYNIADRDPQQTEIFVLLTCGVKANLMRRIWYRGLRKL